MNQIRNVTEPDGREGYRPLYDDVRSTFVDNLLRVLKVAGGIGEDGELMKITKGELAAMSGVSSGTITNLTARDAEDIKLETLCKIGHALNISPAFLLMTDSDWDVLMQAVATMSTLAAHGDTDRLVTLLEEGVKQGRAEDGAKAGLKYIEELRNEDYSVADRERQMRGVLAMAVIALSAFRYDPISPKVSALAMGATLGDREIMGNKKSKGNGHE